MHNGAVKITRQGKTNRCSKGILSSKGSRPHTVKAPAPVAFRALYVRILLEESSKGVDAGIKLNCAVLWRCVVSVTTAHKILISVAVLFFFWYALWELRQYYRLGEVGALLRGVGSLIGAVGFGVYLRSFVRSLRN